MENAKTVVWILEMCITDTAAFFPCIVTGITSLFIYIKNFPLLSTGDFSLQLASYFISLQLPPPQLESALNKYANLRGPLATYASQPSVKASLPRYTIVHLVDHQLYFMEVNLQCFRLIIDRSSKNRVYGFFNHT